MINLKVTIKETREVEGVVDERREMQIDACDIATNEHLDEIVRVAHSKLKQDMDKWEMEARERNILNRKRASLQSIMSQTAQNGPNESITQEVYDSLLTGLAPEEQDEYRAMIDVAHRLGAKRVEAERKQAQHKRFGPRDN